MAVDQRDRSRIEAREVGLVAADDRDVAGDGDVLLLDGAEHADEDPIARRDDRGRTIASLQQSEGGAVAEIGGQAERVDEVVGADEPAAAKGIQYRRISTPMGVPGPVRVRKSFCSRVVIVSILADRGKQRHAALVEQPLDPRKAGLMERKWLVRGAQVQIGIFRADRFGVAIAIEK